MKIIKKIRVLLDRKQKLNLVYLIFLMLVSAILEAASITLIFPVIQTIIEPGAVEKGITGWLYRLLGCKDITSFVVIVMVGMIVAFVIKNLFLLYEQKALFSFVYSNQYRMSKRMMNLYLHKDYESYLNADSAVILRVVTTDVSNMFYYILALMQLISEIVMFVVLAVLMLATNALMTLIVATVLLITLLVIKRLIKPTVRRSGQENQDYYSAQLKWINQSIVGIKDVKIAGRESYFMDRFDENGRAYVAAIQRYNILGATPRLLIETICIAAVLGYLIFMVVTGSDVTSMTSVMALLALAIARLMPCANRINNHLTSLAYFEPFFLGVSDSLQEDIHSETANSEFDTWETAEIMPVHEKVSLRNITYAYPGTEKKIFDCASVDFPAGKSVGIVGSSGAGKTTLVDVLLGLLQPSEGTVLADDVDVRTNYHGFLKNVGYIPQNIFMVDDTIEKNVAFGVAEDKIDKAKVRRALEEARLTEFVDSLPEGDQTKIGERGIRISGGQRQRIGIARAIYEDPEILILDEATSALDNETESAIMESINSFLGKKTLIIIAHRLQTIEKCDLVYRVRDGKIERER